MKTCIFFWTFLSCSSYFSASASFCALISSKWAILVSASAVSFASFVIFDLMLSIVSQSVHTSLMGEFF